MSRLASEFWVKAYIRRLSLVNIPAFVVSHGDDTAGAVLIKLSTLDGQARLFHRSYDMMTGDQTWAELSNGSEPDIDQLIQKQRSFDPDLWVIEIEDSQGRHFLDDF
jgi:hypothetical protein